MSQHFLLTAAARTVSLKQILRMEEDEAWTMFCSIRWPETEGAPRFRCSACRRDFSPTSGTLPAVFVSEDAAASFISNRVREQRSRSPEVLRVKARADARTPCGRLRP